MEANRGIRSGGHTTSGDQKPQQQGQAAQAGTPAGWVAAAPGTTAEATTSSVPAGITSACRGDANLAIAPAAGVSAPNAKAASTSAAKGRSLEDEMPRPPAALAELKSHVALLNAEAFASWGDGEALAGLAALETVKRMIEARQALLTTHIVQARCLAAEAAERSVRNVPAEVGKDLGLARKLNGSRARHLVDLASECPDQAPQTFRLWVDGKVSEEQALTLFKHTSLLTPAGRSEADDTLAEDLPNLGLRELRKRLDGVVAQLEPELVAERRKKAAEQRRAGFTYRPDGMMNLNALLPGIAGQAMETILSTYARSKRHGKDGHDEDERTQDQLKADLLTALVIGWAKATKGVPDEFLKTHHIGCGGQPGHPCTQTPEVSADGNAAGESCAPTIGFGDVETVGDLFSQLVPEDDGTSAPGQAVPVAMEYDPTLGLLLPAGVGVHVNLVMTDLAAFGITDQPAQIFGLGPYPAEMARELIHTAHTRHAATLRRLYTEPTSGALMRMESTARTFPDGLGKMLALRDGHCRYPFCDAPIRHLDHIQRHADGGPTSYSNGQGLCARHNLLKEADGTTTEPEPSTHSEPSTPDDISLCGQGSSAVAGRDTGRGGGVIDTEIGTQAARDDDANNPSGQRGREILGGGAILTVLSNGMKFTSPTRAFPTESPMSVAEDHYWRGYREGRGDQRQQQAEREHDLQRQEDVIFAAEDHLKQMADALLGHGTA